MKIGILKFLIIILIVSSILSINFDLLLNKVLLENFGIEQQESFFLMFFFMTFLPMIIAFLPKDKKSNFNYDTIPENFEKIYKELNDTHNYEFKKISNAFKKTSLFIKLLLIILVILLFIEIIYIFSTQQVRYIFWIFILTCFAIILLLSSKKDKLKYNYINLYKEKIISNFINKIQLDYIYNSNEEKNKLYKEEYYNASFDNISIQWFRIKDYLEGYIDKNLYIRAANLELLNRATKHSYITVFNGLFVSSSLSKFTNTFIKISLNNNFILDSKKHLEMDSGKFENYFDIYTENKFESMKILTHDVMEKLVDFYEKYNIPFEITLKNTKIYLRFFTKNLFIPQKFDGQIDKEELLKYYFILNFIIDVTKEINTILTEKDI